MHQCNCLSCTALVIYLTQRKSTCIHTSIHFNHVHHFHIIDRKYGCRSKMNKITYLKKSSICNQPCHCNVPPNHRLVCSLISQQRCHPRARHDYPRNKGTTRMTHSQVYTNIAKPTQLGLSGHPGVGKG